MHLAAMGCGAGAWRRSQGERLSRNCYSTTHFNDAVIRNPDSLSRALPTPKLPRGGARAVTSEHPALNPACDACLCDERAVAHIASLEFPPVLLSDAAKTLRGISMRARLTCGRLHHAGSCGRPRRRLAWAFPGNIAPMDQRQRHQDGLADLGSNGH